MAPMLVDVSGRIQQRVVNAQLMFESSGPPLCTVRRVVDDEMAAAAREAGLRPVAPPRALRLLYRQGRDQWAELCASAQLTEGVQVYAVFSGDSSVPPYVPAQLPLPPPLPASELPPIPDSPPHRYTHRASQPPFPPPLPAGHLAPPPGWDGASVPPPPPPPLPIEYPPPGSPALRAATSPLRPAGRTAVGTGPPVGAGPSVGSAAVGAAHPAPRSSHIFRMSPNPPKPRRTPPAPAPPPAQPQDFARAPAAEEPFGAGDEGPYGGRGERLYGGGDSGERPFSGDERSYGGRGERPYGGGSSERPRRDWSPPRPSDCRHVSPEQPHDTRLWSPSIADAMISPASAPPQPPPPPPPPQPQPQPRRQPQPRQQQRRDSGRQARERAASERKEQQPADSDSEDDGGREETVQLHPRSGEKLGLDMEPVEGGGLRVRSTIPGGAAERGGIPPGATVKSINGRRVRSEDDVRKALQGRGSGPVDVTFVRPRSGAVVGSFASLPADEDASTARQLEPAPRSVRKEGQLSTPEEAHERVQAAKRVEHPESKPAPSPQLRKAFPDNSNNLLRVVLLEKVNHRGGRDQRALAITRYNVYLSTRDGTVKRVLQYRAIAGLTVRPIDDRVCQLWLRGVPPEHDLLFKVSDTEQGDVEAGAEPHSTVREMISLMGRAKEHIAAEPLEVEWLERAQGPDLAKVAHLKKRPGWTDPSTLISAKDRDANFNVVMSGAEYAPPLSKSKGGAERR